MLALVLRLPWSILGILAIGALCAHLAVLPGVPDGSDRWMESLFSCAGLLLVGRTLLALLPPGSVGEHTPRELVSTLALCTVLGALFSEAASANLDTSCIPHLPREVEVGAFVLLFVAGFVRWLTLPGAMVPRHRVASETTPLLDGIVLLAASAWIALLLARTGAQAVLWVALFACVFHALGVARRAPLGRHAVLLVGASCSGAGGGALTPALGLGLGACFLVPWLRRADRRAGAVVGLAFGSLYLSGPEPLAFAASSVFVLASHARQRRFAALWLGVPALLCALRAWAAPLLYNTYGSYGDNVVGPRRTLSGWFLREQALDPDLWGLAWVIVIVALALGAATFPWRPRPWVQGTVEPPRREALALVALLCGAVLSLALPLSPWYEEDALRILFPLCALLAGLVLIPPERVPANG